MQQVYWLCNSNLYILLAFTYVPWDFYWSKRRRKTIFRSLLPCSTYRAVVKTFLQLLKFVRCWSLSYEFTWTHLRRPEVPSASSSTATSSWTSATASSSQTESCYWGNFALQVHVYCHISFFDLGGTALFRYLFSA